LEVSQTHAIVRFENGRWHPTEGAVVREVMVRLHVNGNELARLMCTPHRLDWLALGFLRSEGIIAALTDVRLLKVCPSEMCVDVWLHRSEFQPPARWTITSGCGGGITFADLSEAAEPLTADVRVTAGQLSGLMGALQRTQETRGIHTSALAENDRLLAVVEDVGRHNTIDKLLGRCLSEGIPTENRILLSTGRISSEMLYKAARAGIPVVVSRTSPTSLSVALATAWNVTLVGYVRRDSLNVYSGQARVVIEEATFDANL
jgi:FdhD protein